MQHTYRDRDIPLEACRGIAALTVLLWHTMLGFFPNRSGIFPGFDAAKSIAGEFWFGLVYGTAAVTFFFVLSGFVLTRRYFENHDDSAVIRGVIKRWPRLAGPATMVTVLSWALFVVGAYHFEEAGQITNSPWLKQFAYSSWPFKPDLWNAFAQGAFFTFFRGDATYNTSLWTMRYEFIGSFVAFSLVLILRPIHQTRPLMAAAFLVLVGMLCHFASPLYVAFPVGVALAAFLPRERKRLPLWLTIILVVFALYLFGYNPGASKHFPFIAQIFPSGIPETYVHIVGAVLIIMAVVTSAHLRSVLSGRWAARLGELSFPLYLVHVLVLCSVGSFILTVANRWVPAPYPNVIAALATVTVSLCCAVPLAWFDRWWVRQVNTWAVVAPNMARRQHQST